MITSLLLEKMKKGILIKQHDITDCGAACLASIAAHYGPKLPIARIRQYAFTDKKGTNILGMIEAAAKIGLEAKGVKGPFECLKDIPKPAVAHIIVKEALHHFVVLYNVTDRYVEIMDLEREGDEIQKISLEADMAGDIRFVHVAFRYGSRKQVFKDFSLTFKKGQTTAIIGESGSGKTTLISLIQKLYPLQSGSISIGNFTLSQVANASLRRIVGVVPQHIELFTCKFFIFTGLLVA